MTPQVEQSDKQIAESTLAVKWWGVLLIVFGILGWLIMGHSSQDSRLVALETCNVFIAQELTDVKATLKEIRKDQIDRKIAYDLQQAAKAKK